MHYSFLLIIVLKFRVNAVWSLGFSAHSTVREILYFAFGTSKSSREPDRVTTILPTIIMRLQRLRPSNSGGCLQPAGATEYFIPNSNLGSLKFNISRSLVQLLSCSHEIRHFLGSRLTGGTLVGYKLVMVSRRSSRVA